MIVVMRVIVAVGVTMMRMLGAGVVIVPATGGGFASVVETD